MLIRHQGHGRHGNGLPGAGHAQTPGGSGRSRPPCDRSCRSAHRGDSVQPDVDGLQVAVDVRDALRRAPRISSRTIAGRLSPSLRTRNAAQVVNSSRAPTGAPAVRVARPVRSRPAPAADEGVDAGLVRAALHDWAVAALLLGRLVLPPGWAPYGADEPSVCALSPASPAHCTGCPTSPSQDRAFRCRHHRCLAVRDGGSRGRPR